MPTDWLWGLLGGGIIGSAAALYLLVNGRIMGASGIVGELVDGSAGPGWREPTAFLGGLILIPALLVWLAGGAQTHVTAALWPLVLGGVLVGVGTRLANGCTSGHGVCGISRLAPRGIVATLVYIGAGAATIAVLRHILGVL
jgi:uncharacterized protein